MAMVFTLVSQLQESLRSVVEDRVHSREKKAAEAERRVIEVPSCSSLLDVVVS
jgi:hypothetical protein